MPDHATSSSPAVQAQLDRLWALGPGADVLGLDRITRLLARLGDPHLRLPPVFHVAGTNGKGSTCAFLRAALEAAGYRVHAYTSPHLVRFNERIRLAGALIADDALAALLGEVLDAGGDIGASFFEVTTAAAFLAFARTPADACVIEVGLGGRLDATNVLPAPAVCGIAALGIDHQAFLGDMIEAIAAEKAGIAKRGVPLVTMAYPANVAAPIRAAAARAGAPLLERGPAWDIEDAGTSLHYRDACGSIVLPAPPLGGGFQHDNLGLAVAMLRHQRVLRVDDAALAEGAIAARWPARMQRLEDGPLVRRLGQAPAHGVWLDGAHNQAAAEAVAARWPRTSRPALVLGILANKDARGIIAALLDRRPGTTVIALPVPGHAHHAPADLVALAREHGAADALTAADIATAFDTLAATARDNVLVAGSLYLAGEVLAANDEAPK